MLLEEQDLRRYEREGETDGCYYCGEDHPSRECWIFDIPDADEIAEIRGDMACHAWKEGER